ncbi:MAG: hypothetical protein V9E83_10980 [Baekduia sp.]
MSGRVLLSIVGLVMLLAAFAYLSARRSIEATEQLAEKAALAQTGREIDVRCPGPIAERFDKPLLEGQVRFDGDGVPLPYTKLSPKACKGLRVLEQRITRLDWDCLPATFTPGFELASSDGTTCRNEEPKAALGVAVLAHELMHLRGVADEARAECLARKRLPAVAAALGLDEREIAAVSAYQVNVLGPQLGPQYQGGSC